jgi:hypothetical protein
VRRGAGPAERGCGLGSSRDCVRARPASARIDVFVIVVTAIVVTGSIVVGSAVRVAIIAAAAAMPVRDECMQCPASAAPCHERQPRQRRVLAATWK